MLSNLSTSQKLDEAAAILSNLNRGFSEYLALIESKDHVAFLTGLQSATIAISDKRANEGLNLLFEVLDQYPKIKNSFDTGKDSWHLRFTIDDVIKTDNEQRKLNEIENEVPALEEKIRQIIEKYSDKNANPTQK